MRPQLEGGELERKLAKLFTEVYRSMWSETTHIADAESEKLCTVYTYVYAIQQIFLKYLQKPLHNIIAQP